MKLETFQRIFQLYKDNEKFLDDSREILAIDFGETVGNSCFWEALDIIWENAYTQEGINWINWFMFERSNDRVEPQAWDKDGTPILNSIKELWEYVETNNRLHIPNLDSFNSGYDEGYSEGVASQKNT